jgi:hypothetical protein
VAGMVLVDGSTEDQDLRLWTLESPEDLKMMDAPNPEAIRLDGLRTAMAQLRGANRSIGDKPLVVLTAGGWEDPAPGTSPEMNARQARTWQEMQAELPQRISSNSTQIVAAKSHHFIQLENPKLVVASIRQVVEAVRTRGRVDASALAPLANEAAVP